MCVPAGFNDVRVFGSIVGGQDHGDSDIDLQVAPPTGATPFDLARLERTLSELLGERVDIVPAAGLRASLRAHVLAEAIPL